MALFFSEKINNVGEVYVWKVTESEDDLFSLRVLSKAEQSYFQRFKNPQKRLHWLAYRVLLGEILGSDFEINYLEDGKPMLVYPQKFLSVSHSKDFVAVFLSETHAVGVDIEKISDRIQKIVPKFLSEPEQKNCNLSDSFLLHFYWGAKESVYKMFNQHRLLFAEQIHIDSIDLKKQKATATIKIDTFQTEVQLIFRKIEDYILVCSF